MGLSWAEIVPQILMLAFSLNGRCSYFKGRQSAVQSQLKRWNSVSVVWFPPRVHLEVIDSKLLSVLSALHLPGLRVAQKVPWFSAVTALFPSFSDGDKKMESAVRVGKGTNLFCFVYHEKGLIKGDWSWWRMRWKNWAGVPNARRS